MNGVFKHQILPNPTRSNYRIISQDNRWHIPRKYKNSGTSSVRQERSEKEIVDGGDSREEQHLYQNNLETEDNTSLNLGMQTHQRSFFSVAGDYYIKLSFS